MDLDLNCRDISSRGEDYPYSYSNQSETEQGLANERPVFRSRDLSRPMGGQTWLEVFVTRLWFIDSDIRAPTSALLTRNSCVTNTCVENLKNENEFRNSKMTSQELLYTQTGRNSKVIIKETSVKGDCKKCWRLCFSLLERKLFGRKSYFFSFL